jgi:hypothetical protein
MTKRFLPPDGALLNSLANANHTWWIVLAEWIDNAFDANAKTISIEFAKNLLRLVDDGDGCADPTDMIRLGAHSKHASTGLGRYGIGGKEAALWVGGINSIVDISTIKGGHRRTLSLPWAEYQQKWEIEEPSDYQAKPGEIGTEITVTPTKKPPSGNDWKNLLERLGYLYSAALKQGRQIKFKRSTKGSEWEPLLGWRFPKVQGEIIDTTIRVHGKLTARVYCGVVRQGEANPRAGFTYHHKWRVIEQASGNGCGDYGPAHMCGFVELDGSWPLKKNKDGIRDEEANALYAAVEETARPVLERAKQIGTELSSVRFETATSDQLNALLAPHQKRKAKRDRTKKEKPGTKHATGTGAKHTKAANEQDGTTFPRKSGGYKVCYDHIGEADRIGQVKAPNSVILNLDNAMVFRIRQDQDIRAAVILAANLIGAEHCYAPNAQPLLPGIQVGTSTEDFAKAVGTILSTDLAVDGKPVLYPVAA